MAIVANLGNVNTPIDKPLCTPNRTNAGEPNTGVTPQYVGEIVLDTTNNALWKAVGLTTSSWVALTPF